MMGKTVIKHEDVDKLYEALVEEIFGVTLPIESEKEKENK
jgi:hypothetical protein